MKMASTCLQMDVGNSSAKWRLLMDGTVQLRGVYVLEDAQSQQARDIERFRWFSNGYVALDRLHPNRVIDIRYSMLPHEIDPLWGIQLDPGAGRRDHVKYVVTRDGGAGRAAILWQMLTSG